MRNESILKSMQRIANVEPSIWRDMQKHVNKFNETTGTKHTMFDLLSDRGKNPVHMNAREDEMLGDVPDMPMKGTGHDDRIGMVTPRQEFTMRMMGGSGRRNPKTGLREYDWGDSSGDSGSYIRV